MNMTESSQPDFSFITDDMSAQQMNDAYRDAYLRLWENGLHMVESLREEIRLLTQEKYEWQKQEQFGIKVIEHLRAQLQYYEEKYPNDRPPFADDKDSQAMISQYDQIRSNNLNNLNRNNNNNNNNNYYDDNNNIYNNSSSNNNNNHNSNDLLSVFANNTGNANPSESNNDDSLLDPKQLKHKLFLERRTSEYLRQECDDLQNELQALQQREDKTIEETEKETVAITNQVWEQQLYSVFEQIAEQGHDIGSLKIDFDTINDKNNNNNNNNNNINNNNQMNNIYNQNGNGNEHNANGNFGQMNGSSRNGDNLTGDPNTIDEVRGMRKNLVRLYTKTDWNESELRDLKDDMLSQMQELQKSQLAKMTHNPNIMTEFTLKNSHGNASVNTITNATIVDHNHGISGHDHNDLYDDSQYELQALQQAVKQAQAQAAQAHADAMKFRNMYEEAQGKLDNLEREYSQKILEHEEGIRAMRDQMNELDERCETVIRSKIDFINAVSSEMQHLREMIHWYNPEGKYRQIVDKIVRYHDLAPGQGNSLFQLIENAELQDPTLANKRRKSQIASASIENDPK